MTCKVLGETKYIRDRVTTDASHNFSSIDPSVTRSNVSMWYQDSNQRTERDSFAYKVLSIYEKRVVTIADQNAWDRKCDWSPVRANSADSQTEA